MMADKGIIFSAPMVRAMLDGRKTQTRRLLSRANLHFNGGAWPKGLQLHDMKLDGAWVDLGPSPAGNDGPYLKADWPYGRLIDGDTGEDAEWLMARLYPKTQPGDRLYVREAWSHTGDHVFEISQARRSGRSGVIYRADDNPKWPHAKYWPSIHMPREFSRLTLTVTEVRVQRLQEISEEDAVAEGIDEAAIAHFGDPIKAYAALWDHLHGGESDHGWSANPWVVAVSFSGEHRNIDA